MGAFGAKDMKSRLNNSVTTLVGTDSIITGNLTFRHGCHVAGVVKGDVMAASGKKTELTVAQGGRVEGNAQAARMLIHGTVVGDLCCSGTISLSSSGRVQGSIEYAEIEIEKGAIISGSLTMLSAKAEKSTAAQSAHHARPETGDRVHPLLAE